MAKFRKRVKGGKAPRWRKGQSASCNPSGRKYREAAKSGFFNPLPGESNLTTAALSAFNDRDVDIESRRTRAISVSESVSSSEACSFGGTTNTFDTFASDWSACSNQSFSKLITKFRADSAVHKDMLAVLAAVTEVIKQKGGQESSTEYFGALMTALSTDEYEDEQVTAILNLLCMVIKSTPRPVLQATFSETSSTLLTLLNKFSQTEKVSLIRSVLGCLSFLLRAQDVAVWSEPSTLLVMQSVLAFVTFSKPKIRKAAQHSIISVVKLSNITPLGLGQIAEHCTKLVESVCLSGGVTTTLHVLGLLKDIMHKFPPKHLKSCCEGVLKVMTLNNVLVTSCSLQALHGMFSAGAPDKSVPAKFNARLINALYDFQPPKMDIQPLQAWLAVMQQAFIALSKSDAALCLLNLPKLYRTCSELYHTEKTQVMATVTLTLQTVTDEALSFAAAAILNPSSAITQVSQICEIHLSLLSYQYHGAYNYVFHLIGALFKATGINYKNCLTPIIKTLGELRDTGKVLFLADLDNAVGAAIRSLGPDIVVDQIPLQISANDQSRDFKRSWLLPVLKENIKGSPLATFMNNFLPLAALCKNECERLKNLNDQVGAVSYDLLQSQIWALLPSFSTNPPDIAVSFPGMAKALGGVLSSRKDLRLIILSSLRRLISHSLEGSEQDRQTMTRFAKNYLPILFNMYSTKISGSDEEGIRLACLETIKVYLKVAPDELNKELFDRAFRKLNDESDGFVKESVLDLIRALTPFQNYECISSLYEMISSNLASSTENQKKFYRLLEEIFTTQTQSCQEFIRSNTEGIKKLLLSSFSKCTPGSKLARLVCVLELIKVARLGREFALTILPESVLSLKEVNSKAQQTAHKILEVVFSTEDADLEHLVGALLSGLTGTPAIVSCTVLALASFVFHTREKIPPELLDNILHNVGVLTVCSTREIVSACMAFIKVFITSRPRPEIELYVPQMMKLLSSMTEDCKRHNRTRTRDLLSRLVRWFGGETILRHIPRTDTILQTRVRNLAKMTERKKRRREEERTSRMSEETAFTTFTTAAKHKSIEDILGESDSDLPMDEDEIDESVKKAGRKNKKNKTWITEDADDIVDFTETRNASKNIIATNPEVSKKVELNKSNALKKKQSRDFKKAPDGRLIIADLTDDESNEGDEDGDAPKKSKKPKSVIPGLDKLLSDSSDESDIDENEWMTSAGETITSKGKKRALTASSATTSKYRAGGSGIHRPLSTASSAKMKKNASKKRKIDSSVVTGTEYRNSKARGDVKRKGLPDPYAYVPLRRDMLNKRKRMKASAQMKNILKAARKGAVVGTSSKIRKLKR